LHLGEGAVAELDFSGFVKQFMGVSINACLLDKDGGEIDGITGATKSSKAVVDAVREICFYKIQLIK
jgi:Na+-translocating ferredoxin:NAD+ oxidoreductase RnfG subunit